VDHLHITIAFREMAAVPKSVGCGLVWQRLRKSRLAMAVEGLVRGPRAGGTVWGMAPWLFAFANDLRLAD